MADFSHRSAELELMDDPEIAAEELHVTLDELEFINRTLGGYRPSLRGLSQLLPAGCRSFRLLDVGTGGGDLPRRVVHWASRRGVEAAVRGIDLSAVTVNYAREKARSVDGVHFEATDVYDLHEEEQFDIAHAALTLHHFDDQSALRVLRKMFALSRWGIVINDLHRHPLAYHSIRVLTRWLSKSRLIQNDAPLSVLRAFTRDDLDSLVRRAGLPPPRITWHWAFRWLVVVEKTQSSRK